MRVLFIGPLPEPVTGQSLACQVFLDELSRHAEVEVVNLSKAGFRQGVDSLRRIVEVLRIVWRAWRGSRRADIVYFTIAESWAGHAKDLLVCLVCLDRLDRTVLHLHGGAGMRGILARPGPLRALNDFILRRIGAMVVLGRRLEGMYAGRVPTERLHVVPNFAPDELFTEPAAIRAKFDATQPLRLLFLSNLLPGKGHEELLTAFQSLSPTQRVRLRLDFAGGFESDADRDRFLARLLPHPELRYHGTVRGAEKQALFAQAHLFCLPTYYPYEGQPISILEAYAAGCAVVTTDHSGIFDVFDPGVNGMAVEQRSVDSLRAALQQALESPAELERMALANLERAQREFRVGTYNGRLLEVLRRVAQAAGSSAA